METAADFSHVAQLQFKMMCERPPAAFDGSPPREGETRAKRARGSLTHHLKLQLSNKPFFLMGDTLCLRTKIIP
jgi:hypothetical protein